MAAEQFIPGDARLVLWLPFPLPSLNDVISWAKQRNASFSEYQQRKRHLELMIQVQARAQLPSARIDHRVFMTYVWVEGSAHPRDPSNVAAGGRKFVEDALATAWLWDDSIRHVAGFSDHFVVEPSRLGVLVGFSYRGELELKDQRVRSQKIVRTARLRPRRRSP